MPGLNGKSRKKHNKVELGSIPQVGLGMQTNPVSTLNRQSPHAYPINIARISSRVNAGLRVWITR